MAQRQYPMTSWTTKTGVVLPLDRMSNDHLINAVMMCLRQNKLKMATILATELDRRLPDDDVDILDDCVVVGCDRYGSIG